MTLREMFLAYFGARPMYCGVPVDLSNLNTKIKGMVVSGPKIKIEPGAIRVYEF